jgi:hypothetical protein
MISPPLKNVLISNRVKIIPYLLHIFIPYCFIPYLRIDRKIWSCKYHDLCTVVCIAAAGATTDGTQGTRLSPGFKAGHTTISPPLNISTRRVYYDLNCDSYGEPGNEFNGSLTSRLIDDARLPAAGPLNILCPLNIPARVATRPVNM